MKATTMYQPWASLLIWDLKGPETRPLRMNHRGELAIHSGLKSIREACRIMKVSLSDYERMHGALREKQMSEGMNPRASPMPSGHVLGIVEVTDCVPTQEIRDSLTDFQRLCGNYADGRWAILYEVLERFETPIPCKGAQGLWEWER